MPPRKVKPLGDLLVPSSDPPAPARSPSAIRQELANAKKRQSRKAKAAKVKEVITLSSDRESDGRQTAQPSVGINGGKSKTANTAGTSRAAKKGSEKYHDIFSSEDDEDEHGSNTTATKNNKRLAQDHVDIRPRKRHSSALTKVESDFASELTRRLMLCIKEQQAGASDRRSEAGPSRGKPGNLPGKDTGVPNAGDTSPKRFDVTKYVAEPWADYFTPQQATMTSPRRSSKTVMPARPTKIVATRHIGMQRTSSLDVVNPTSPTPSSPYIIDANLEGKSDKELARWVVKKGKRKAFSSKPFVQESDEDSDGHTEILPKGKKRKSNTAQEIDTADPQKPPVAKNKRKKPKKTAKKRAQDDEASHEEWEASMPQNSVADMMEELNVNDALRKSLESTGYAKLNPLIKEADRAFIGYALVDITHDEDSTPAGYKINTDGTNKRKATPEGVEILYDATHEGVAIHNNVAAHALIGAASKADLDLSSLTENPSGNFCELKVIKKDAVVTLANGSHRRAVDVQRVIIPAEKSIATLRSRLQSCVVGSSQAKRFEAEISRLKARLEQYRCWLMKIYDLDAILASENAGELLALLSSNSVAQCIPEGDANKLWMIADSLNSLPSGSTRADMTDKLAIQSSLYVDGRSGDKLRMATTNVHLMKAFALVSQSDHFKKAVSTGVATSPDRLKPIAWHTDCMFLATVHASWNGLQLFGSKAVGDSCSADQFRLLSKADQINHIDSLTAKVKEEVGSKTGWTPSIELMELIDKSFLLVLEPDFARLFGAPVGSVRYVEWQKKLNDYTESILKAIQANNLPDDAKMIAKRLFYVLDTPLQASFEGVNVDTPMPIFTRSVMLGWTTLFGGAPSKRAKRSDVFWRTFNLLARALTGMVDYTAYRDSYREFSTFELFVNRVHAETGKDVTIPLANLFIREHNQGWSAGFDAIESDAVALHTSTHISMRDPTPAVMKLYDIPEQNVETYNKILRIILWDHMVKRDATGPRRPIQVTKEVEKHGRDLSKSLGSHLYRALVMLNNTTWPWHVWKRAGNEGSNQLKRETTYIHIAVAYETMLRNLSKNPFFDRLRTSMLAFFEPLNDDGSFPDTILAQWDNIPNVASDLRADATYIPGSESPADPMSLFELFDKKLLGILKHECVFGLKDGKVKQYHEGLATAVDSLRKQVFLSHAKMAAVIKNPDVEHMDLDVAWAENELQRVSPTCLPTLAPSMVDDFYDELASTWSKGTETGDEPPSDQDSDEEPPSEEEKEDMDDEEMEDMDDEEKEDVDDEEKEDVDDEEKEDMDDEEREDADEEDDNGMNEEDNDAGVDDTDWAAADVPVFDKATEMENGEGPVESEAEEDDVGEQEKEEPVDNKEEPVDDDEAADDYRLDDRAGLVFIPTQPNSPALPPSDESEDSEFQESEKDALFIKLIDCYWALQSRVLTHNRSEEKLILAGENINWLQEVADKLDIHLIVESSIYKALYHITLIDITTFPPAHMHIINVANALFTEWNRTIAFDPARLMEPLPLPASSQPTPQIESDKPAVQSVPYSSSFNFEDFPMLSDQPTTQERLDAEAATSTGTSHPMILIYYAVSHTRESAGCSSHPATMTSATTSSTISTRLFASNPAARASPIPHTLIQEAELHYSREYWIEAEIADQEKSEMLEEADFLAQVDDFMRREESEGNGLMGYSFEEAPFYDVEFFDHMRPLEEGGPDFDMEALLELEASLVETDSFLDDGEMICMAEEEMRDKDGENMDAA